MSAANVYANTSQGTTVAKYSVKMEGIRYKRGGDTPHEGFDCSGLVKYVFDKKVGTDLPRTSAELAKLPAKKLQLPALKKGDILFFKTRGRIDHVGIYVGNKKFVHAAGRSGGVKVASLKERYWKSVFVFGKRVR
jgi:cell wall-associated NlpC family hydrolase